MRWNFTNTLVLVNKEIHCDKWEVLHSKRNLHMVLFVLRPWWRHQMETFSASLALCEGNHRSLVDSTRKGQWRGALMFSFCLNKELSKQSRRQRAHYEGTVMQRAWDLINILRKYDTLQTFEKECRPESDAILYENNCLETNVVNQILLISLWDLFY